MAAQSYPSYPTVGDIATFLLSFSVFKGTGFSESQQVVVQSLLNTRIQQFERTTGYMPFLCAQDGSGNPVQTTRLFDPPGNSNSPTRLGGYYWFSAGAAGRGNRLRIECGFTSPNPVVSPTIYVDVSDGFAGNLLVYQQDYIIQPNNAAVEGKPYTEIQFLWDQFGGLDQSISITGYFGYGQDIPADAWQAIVYGTAADLMPQIGLLQLGDRIETKEKDEEVISRQGNARSAYDLLAENWNRQFNRIIAYGGYIREYLS